jgi:predicted lipoprotein
MKKIIITIVSIAVVIFLIYNSVYFTSLSAHKAELEAAMFNPKEAIETFWNAGRDSLWNKAEDLGTFNTNVQKDATATAHKYGHTLGIGAPYSLLIKGKARIATVDKDKELIRLDVPGSITYYIRTGSIFSNTVREASGYFDLDKFETTMDFNLVAMAINSRIQKEVINPVAAQLIEGNMVEFLGATDINLKQIPVNSVEIIPLRLKIITP